MVGLGMQEILILGVLFLGAIGAIAAIVVAVNRSSGSGRSEQQHRPD